jgi:uncharacterized membrane protein
MADRRSRIDRWVRIVLVAGMALSISVIVLGLFLYAATPVSDDLGDLPLDKLPEAVLGGVPEAIIDLGIVLLILTPLARVLTTAVVFTIDREPRFVAAALLVLFFLGVAILLK